MGLQGMLVAHWFHDILLISRYIGGGTFGRGHASLSDPSARRVLSDWFLGIFVPLCFIYAQTMMHFSEMR